MGSLPNIYCFRAMIRLNDAEALDGLRYSSTTDKLSLSVSEGYVDLWNGTCVED